jgi:hypothetical protein
MENGGFSDFPIETYRQLPGEGKKFLKFIYRGLVLVQNSIFTKEPVPKGEKKPGNSKFRQ